MDSRISEQDEDFGTPLEDARAAYLVAHPGLTSRWRDCRAKEPAEKCLDAVLPLTGPPSIVDPEAADWISRRDRPKPPGSPALEATCRLDEVRRKSGRLVFACEGPLAVEFCKSRSSQIFSLLEETEHVRRAEPSCSGNAGPLRFIVEVGRVPPEDCARKARRALSVASDSFPLARRAALDACMKEAVPADYWKETGWASAFQTSPIDQADLPRETRAVIARILERQVELFGALTLPPRCERTSEGCISPRMPEGFGGFRSRRLAGGCGYSVWTVEQLDRGMGLSGAWHFWEGQWLLRVRGEGPPRVPESEAFMSNQGAPFTIGDTERSGNYALGRRGPLPHSSARNFTEGDLIANGCATAGEDRDVCVEYAEGGFIEPCVSEPCPFSRVHKLIADAWPHASLRLDRWQREMAEGTRLDDENGEQHHEICTPVLVDACTGDVAEKCARLEPRIQPCDGTRLSDGRCESWHFGRLPLFR